MKDSLSVINERIIRMKSRELKDGGIQKVGDRRFRVCGSRRSNRKETCLLAAGLGTDHLGRGKCKFHGGCSTGPRKGSGLYRKHALISVLTPKEKRRLEEFLAGGNTTSQAEEIAYSRTLLMRVVEAEQGKGGGELSLAIIDRITKLVGTEKKLTEAKAIQMKAEEFRAAVNAIVSAFHEANKCPTRHERAKVFINRLSAIDGNGDQTTV